MKSWVCLARALPLLLGGAGFLAGCLPSAQSQLDEEREYHFLAGKSRVNAMDYVAAIECFEKALEANPRSAAAHFELGWLFDQKETDPAAAIYHYGAYLKLRPNADNLEMVRTRMLACKQELARTVSLGPVTQTLQREFEQLTEENKRLRQEAEQWHAAYNALAGARATTTNASPTPPPQAAPAGATRSGVTIAVMSDPSRSPVAPGAAAPAPTTGRTHTVKAGETAFVIARKYGVKLETLLAANPRVEPRRLRVGQTLAIP